jgi:hypothetical protein
MIILQGMDELFWGKDHEDVNDWAGNLIIVAEVEISMMTSCLR